MRQRKSYDYYSKRKTPQYQKQCSKSKTCAETGKRQFISARAAERFADKLHNCNQTSYQCPFCDQYHLTTVRD